MTGRAEVLALIPARGGSKGIPRKNLLELAGKPLIAYSIEQALASRTITRVVVSTEDDEIARISAHYGAEIPFLRPPEFATDTATDFEVFTHALRVLGERDYVPELVVQLRPTTPVRKLQVIDAAVSQMLQRPDADSLKSVSEADPTPYKMWRVDADGLVPLMEIEGLPEAHSMPRQILPTVYAANGYLDIIRPHTILSHKSMVGKTVLPLIITEPSYDLDHPAQLPALEAALRTMQAQSSGEHAAVEGLAGDVSDPDTLAASQIVDVCTEMKVGN